MISVERANEIAIAIGNDENKIKELLDLSPEEAVAKLNSDGNDFTAQELVDFAEFVKKSVPAEGELGEEALENVAGGLAAELVFCGGVLVGMYMNKNNIW